MPLTIRYLNVHPIDHLRNPLPPYWSRDDDGEYDLYRAQRGREAEELLTAARALQVMARRRSWSLRWAEEDDFQRILFGLIRTALRACVPHRLAAEYL